MDEEMWRVDIWDGDSNRTFYRKGTYEYVYSSVNRHVPSHIVTVSSIKRESEHAD